jgi:SAM-dependent methyltransferase
VISAQDQIYPATFYDDMSITADHAAQQALPFILSAVRPASVVDVGCGAGAWARAFHNAGVADVIGVDGGWIDPKTLLIPPETFVQADLTRPFGLPRRFDLCLSLETAEHLSEDRSAGFVQDLTRLSDVVVFSAAVPFQGGTHHLNERWQTYWVEKFADCGYVGVDYLRRRIWHLERFNTWFYSQNMIIYIRADALTRYPALDAEYGYQAGPPVSLAHPGLVLLHLPWEKDLSVRSYFRLFPRMAARAVGAAMRRLVGLGPAPPLKVPPPGAVDWRERKP